MTKPRQNRRKQNQGGGRIAALAFFVLIILAVGGYLLFSQVMKPAPLPPPSAQKAPLPPRPLDQVYPATPVVPEKAAKPDESGAALPAGAGPKSDAVPGKGQLAIIIDDMGSSMQEARSLAGIGVPLTFSIIPGLRNYREVALFADSSGIETMIHIPMQPKGWPRQRLEGNGLLVSLGDADIRERLEGFSRDIPRAVGANNHMGSEFTEHDGQMRTVLSVLKENKLFFIDSVTTPKTVGLKLAREMGMKSGRRNVFLDNEQNRAYIMGQIDQAVRLAKKSGAAIAICHPHPETIRTLTAALPALERQGITLVPASRLVR